MTTVMIWLGSGFAFSVGVLFGAWIIRSSWKPSPEMRESNDKATAALRERNEIGRLQVAILERIAATMEETADR